MAPDNGAWFAEQHEEKSTLKCGGILYCDQWWSRQETPGAVCFP
jgi:hypothetical protein